MPVFFKLVPSARMLWHPQTGPFSSLYWSASVF